MARLGPERIILQRAQSEQAINFGLAHGINKFQGRHIDAMLSAARLRICSEGQHCSLRQCAERAAATSVATRRCCGNLPLLDRGLPEAEGFDRPEHQTTAPEAQAAARPLPARRRADVSS